MAHSTPLATRPMYLAVCGGIECVALAFGPLIAGAIAAHTTWRVAFYITIPIAVAVIIVIYFGIDQLRRTTEHADLSSKAKLGRIDWAGLATELPMTVCLILALQWAGTQYAWNEWRIILLLSLSGVLLATFLFVEHWNKEKAMVPLKILQNRIVALASCVTFCNFSALWVISFYVSFFLRVLRDRSSIRPLPLTY